MTYKKQFERYESIMECFWPDADKLPDEPDNLHPLLGLVLGDDHKGICGRTNHCVSRIKNEHPNWLSSKSKIVLHDKDYSNVSSTLGEIRALGELIWIWNSNIKTPKDGCDFILETKIGYKVRYEVFTPQHRTKRYSREISDDQSKNVRMKVSERFPFGWPERPTKDNVQGEAVSQLAQIKEKEHQFNTEDISVLWLDFRDPLLWPMDFKSDQLLPISAFREELTSGSCWNAFYGKKELPIFDQLSVLGLPSRSYDMEFDGRFNQNSLIDFVIISSQEQQVVFENHMKTKTIPDNFYKSLYRLFGFNLELSWLDWPLRGNLKSRVEHELETIRIYKNIFKDF